MPRRKLSSPIDHAIEKLVAAHGGNVLSALDEIHEAIWSHSPQAERAFERAESALDGDEKLQRDVAALIQERVDARSGKKQRASGRKGKGVRRDTYKGKPIPSREKLLADVQRMHANEKYRRRSFNWVCNAVAKAHGYKSAGRVKEAAASTKWPGAAGKAK